MFPRIRDVWHFRESDAIKKNIEYRFLDDYPAKVARIFRVTKQTIHMFKNVKKCATCSKILLNIMRHVLIAKNDAVTTRDCLSPEC
jgi:hypothetical protein